MIQNGFSLIGAALGEGAQIPATKKSPAHLKNAGIQNILGIGWDDFLISPDFDGTVSKHDLVYDFNCRLHKSVTKTLSEGRKPIVIGGDHAIAIGTWSAFWDNMGLIWIDAHLDSHTHETSPSGAIHGMPVASLLGYGDERFQHIGRMGPKIKPNHLVFIGARSYEREEHDFLLNLGVKIIYMDDVDRMGFQGAMDAALDYLTDCAGGIGISIDLDAFDPAHIPGVGSPEPGGIHPQDGLDTLLGLAHDPRICGIEITELNPDLDPDGVSCRFATDLLTRLMDR